MSNDVTVLRFPRRKRFGLYKSTLPIILGIDEALGASCSKLQTLCDTLRSYEEDGNYTLLHLAVQMDLQNVVTDPIMIPLLNVTNNSGLTPLMLAVKVTFALAITPTHGISACLIRTLVLQSENIWMVKYLLGKGAALEISDSGGNTGTTANQLR